MSSVLGSAHAENSLLSLTLSLVLPLRLGRFPLGVYYDVNPDLLHAPVLHFASQRMTCFGSLLFSQYVITDEIYLVGNSDLTQRVYTWPLSSSINHFPVNTRKYSQITFHTRLTFAIKSSQVEFNNQLCGQSLLSHYSVTAKLHHPFILHATVVTKPFSFTSYTHLPVFPSLDQL